MRKVAFLMCVLALPSISLAKTDRSSWTTLNGLQAGQSIEILDTSSNTHSGTFVSVSETAISYRVAEGERAIQKPEVRSVKLKQNKHRLRNTLIGAGIGAGAGAAVTAVGWESHGFLGGKGVGAAVGAIIGTVPGAVVGVLLPSHDTIYKVSSH
jgi:hypothetical protein